MSKIIEYKVIELNLAKESTDFSKVLADGWQPLGGVHVEIDPHNRERAWYQAFVKYEGNK